MNIHKCKNQVALLAKDRKESIDKEKLDQFLSGYQRISAEYNKKYMLLSTSIKLEKLESFLDWLSEIKEEKNLYTPIVVDMMINSKDLYALSLYQNLYKGSDLIPSRDSYSQVYEENGAGEHAEALMLACHWLESAL